MKDHTRRPQVQKWLPYWQDIVKEKGEEFAVNCLRHKNGHKTIKLSSKDRLGLLQALKLETR